MIDISVIHKEFHRATNLGRILRVRIASDTSGPNWLVNAGGANEYIRANLGWGKYEACIGVTDELEAEKKQSPNPTAYKDYVKGLVSDAMSNMAQKIEADLFTGSSLDSIIGFDTVLDNSNNYARIDRSSVKHFKASNFNSKEVATNIRQDLASIKHVSGERPNIAACSPTFFWKIAASFGLEFEFVRHDCSIGPRPFVGDSVQPSFMIDGCRFVESSGISDDTIYYFNTGYVHLEVFPYTSFGPLNYLFNYLEEKDNLVSIKVQLVVTKPYTCGKRVHPYI